MRKILALSLVCITSIFCTGCVQNYYKIDISSKDDVTITEIKTLQTDKIKSKKLLSFIEEDKTKLITNLEKIGNNIKPYLKNSNTGFVRNYEPKRLTAIYKTLPVGFIADEHSFNRTRNLIKKSYKINLKYDNIKVLDSIPEQYNKLKKDSIIFKTYKKSLKDPILYTYKDSNTNAYDVKKDATGNTIYINPNTKIKTLKDNCKTELIIKIPTKAIKHNATKELANNEYLWDLSGEPSIKNINIEYDKYDFSLIWFIFSMLLLVGAAIKLSNKASSEPPVKGL